MRGSTQKLPPLCFRAEVGTISEEHRTVELVFSTGAAVERMDWWTGKRYIEKLSLKPDHIKLDRLNAGAPLLDAHSAYSISDQIGVVESDTVKLTAKEARATVRFSKREAVDPIWQDVRDGIIRNVSVGYRILRFEETAGKDGAIPTRLATLWEPYEISMVPMPADIGARVRSEQVELNACEVVTRELPMNEAQNEQSEFIAEPNPLDPGAPTQESQQQRLTLASETQEPNERDVATLAERKRVQGITNAVRAARLPSSVADKLIAEGLSLVDAQTRVFEEMARREPSMEIRHQGGAHIQMGEEPLVHARKGIENAILHRVAPQFFKLEDVGRNYRGLTLLEIGKIFLQARGVRTTSLSKMEIAGLALGLNVRGGLHTTSDYALLLADVANKTLRRAYEEAPQTFTVVARRVSVPDFKPVKRLQLGEAPSLLEINEHGEYTRGTIGEGREQFSLATYGRVFGITRKSLVNDDTDAFSRVTTLFGRAARDLESDLVWEQITSNPTMGDSNALFSAAHANLASPPTAMSVTSLGVARTSMRLQTGVDASRLLNITPRFLVVPPSQETGADQLVGAITPATVANANPFSGRLQVICEPRLETTSSSAWYVFASPDQIDILEYAFLEGEDGPMVESRIGFDVDGLEIKARHDFAAKAIDWRGIYLNEGTGTS